MAESEEGGLDPTSIRDPLLGSKILGYQLRRRIGVGGMGVVYEAEELNIGRRAAVKVLLPEIANQPLVVERLKAEARAANAARHRGIIDIFGFAELPDGRNAIVMEFLEGVALDQKLAEARASGRRLPTLLSLQIIDELAAVLQSAHDAGVVHRDLKPSNVFLCTDPEGATFIKVLDFGIAKVEGLKAGPTTAANVVMGTPLYMSPEQANGEPASPSMDLYAVGVVAFELFTGRVPFSHESLTRVLLAHQRDAPPVPSSIAPGLPAVLDTFILKLLEKEPSKRHHFANEIREEVRALRKVVGDPEAASTDPHLNAPPPITASVAPVGKSRGPIIALALGVAVLASLVAFTFASPRPTAPEVPTPPPVAPVTAPPVAPTLAPIPPQVPDAPAQVDPPKPLKTPSKNTTAESQRKALRARLRKLEKRLQRAQEAGESTTLYRQQLEALTNALKDASSSDKLEAIDTATGRLEQEIR